MENKYLDYEGLKRFKEKMPGLENTIDSPISGNVGGVVSNATKEIENYDYEGTTGTVKPNVASGDFATADGISMEFKVEGQTYTMQTEASGIAAHAEGMGVTASGNMAHAEGLNAVASGEEAHAEGEDTTASGAISHAEGHGTTASGQASHAEGEGTTASGADAHAEGAGTIAQGAAQTVVGAFNVAQGNSRKIVQTDYAFIIGGGTGSNARKNALAVKRDGTVVFVDGTEQTTAAKPIQVATMPTASADVVGKVYQYIGATDANFTHGYFYECVSDGASTPAYSWERKDVQPSSNTYNVHSGDYNPDDGEFYDEETGELMEHIVFGEYENKMTGGRYLCIPAGLDTYEYMIAKPSVYVVPSTAVSYSAQQLCALAFEESLVFKESDNRFYKIVPTEVTSPSGNPKEQNWGEFSKVLPWGVSYYAPTTDTSVQSGKTYYSFEWVEISMGENTYKVHSGTYNPNTESFIDEMTGEALEAVLGDTYEDTITMARFIYMPMMGYRLYKPAIVVLAESDISASGLSQYALTETRVFRTNTNRLYNVVPTEVTNPTGNPKEQKWGEYSKELPWGTPYYAPTTDTTVDSSKTYYSFEWVEVGYDRTFPGTLDEWNALTEAEKAKYDFIASPEEASTTNVVNRGRFNIEYTTLAVEVSQTVTFSQAMPNADYVIIIEPLGVNTSWRISDKSVNGFTITGIKNSGSTGVVQYKYTAFMVD